jgi:imidazolonepropionase-like amidohydrolase
MKWLLLSFFLVGSFCCVAQTYAILADRLIDGKSDQALSNPTIIVRQGKIININFNRSVPDSAIVIDLKGQTVLPGLTDVHTHLLAGTDDYEKDLYGNSPSYRALRAVMHLRTALNNGITTLRDVCSEGAGFADVDLARAVDSGFVDGPRVFPAGCDQDGDVNTARLLRIENKLGQIQKGYIADIIAAKGNPLEDISLLQHVDFVMKEGKLYKRP